MGCSDGWALLRKFPVYIYYCHMINNMAIHVATSGGSTRSMDLIDILMCELEVFNVYTCMSISIIVSSYYITIELK